MLGIMAKKLGMTQVFANDSVVPVTVVSVDPNVVLDVKTREKHGYNAVQLGYGQKKEKHLTKADIGNFKKVKQDPMQKLKEFRTDRAAEYKVGTQINVSFLGEGEKIDVQGTSKGKGFQGVMKRFNFSGGNDSHGASVSHRVPGSIGQCTYPGRVIPGKKLPGHMGNQTVTVKNLVIVGIEEEQNILLIKGAVPGSNNSKITIYPHSQEFENKVLSSGDDKEQEAGGENKAKKEEGKEAAA